MKQKYYRLRFFFLSNTVYMKIKLIITNGLNN
jgi:hypothetical protein